MHMPRFLVAATMLILSASALADKTAGQMVDDVVLLGEVKAKVVDQDFSEGLSINVAVRKGVVQLGGFVDDLAVAGKMVAAAKSVDGVAEVDDQLHQTPGKRSAGQIVDDGVTTTRVNGALANVDMGDVFSVNVDTYNGVVLLTGFVSSAEARERAGDLAARDPNTRKVINGLHVLQ